MANISPRGSTWRLNDNPFIGSANNIEGVSPLSTAGYSDSTISKRMTLVTRLMASRVLGDFDCSVSSAPPVKGTSSANRSSVDSATVVHPANDYGFSVTVCACSKAYFRRYSCSTFRKYNAVCRRRQTRPEGARERSRSGVEILEKGKTFVGEQCHISKPLFGSELAIFRWMGH